jgi:hypothetical protein
MNINQLFGTFAKEMRPVTAGQLELKVGQIVRGVVLKPLDGQDALVNIGGTVVRAHLEAPLKQGEATMLQVQPESTQGQIVLKPLQTSIVPIAEESLTSLIEGMDLQDRPEIRQLVQQMHQTGIPLTKENIEKLASLIMGATGANSEQWNQAAVIAFQRKLPLTIEVVGSLRQALQSETLTQRLDRLSGLLFDAVQSAPGANQAPSLVMLKALAAIRTVNDLAARIIPSAMSGTGTGEAAAHGSEVPVGQRSGTNIGSAQALAASAYNQAAEGEAAASRPGATAAGSTAGLPQAGGGASPAAASPAGGNGAAGTPVAQPAAPQALPGAGAAAGTPAPGSAGALQGASQAVDGPLPQGVAAASSSAPAPAVASPAPASAAEAAVPFGFASGGTTAAASSTAQSASVSTSLPNHTSNTSAPSSANPAGDSAAVAAASGTGQAAPEAPAAGNIVSRLLHALGFSHENLASRLPASADLPQGVTAIAQPLAATADDAALSLKHALLNLASADDIPAAIKDSAQQIVQQLNGQQLLLSADRASVFSQITMFIPFTDSQGNRTASVHIQTRKGKRGEIDADNCRLLFDLNMQAIGNTMVDVQIVDRIVSFQVMNDHPLTAAVLDSEREEIGSALKRIGYKFISMKISPYPESATVQPNLSEPAASSSPLPGAGMDPRSLYRPRPYKGVDVRV